MTSTKQTNSLCTTFTNLLFILIFLAFDHLTFAQNVGIGTVTPNSSAKLDINSTRKGLLIPRMDSAQRKAITTPAHGLLVFDNSTESFWFHSFTGWVELRNGQNNHFMRDKDEDTQIEIERTIDEDIIHFNLGNGANTSTEYFNMNRGRLNVVNTGNSVFIGNGAGVSDDLSSRSNVYIGRNAGRLSTTSANNVAVGFRSLEALGVNSYYNTALGSNSFGNLSTGNYNIGLGAFAACVLSSGNNNILIGNNSLCSLSTGNLNTVIGNDAAPDITTGTRNVCLGYSAGMNMSSGSNNIFIGSSSGPTTYSAINNQLFIDNSTNNNPLIWGDFGNDSLEFNATTTINGSLTINGGANRSVPAVDYFSSASGGIQTYPGGGSGNYSIWAFDRVAAFQFEAVSDVRIKDVKGISNSKKDLNKLMEIEVTDYQYIDKVAEGNQTQKKVIAQQVKEVYPQAVSSNHTRVVPDIYTVSTIKDGWVSSNSKIEIGTRIKIITEEKEAIFEVLELRKGAFRIALDYDGKIFVYGREVNDFHTVDYQAISMLNVSATQELAKRVLKLENARDKRLESLETKINTLLEKQAEWSQQ